MNSISMFATLISLELLPTVKIDILYIRAWLDVLYAEGVMLLRIGGQIIKNTA